jgi:hypothetical protein
MLRELGQKLQRAEDLEVPLDAGRQIAAARIGKTPAGVLLRLVPVFDTWRGGLPILFLCSKELRRLGGWGAENVVP